MGSLSNKVSDQLQALKGLEGQLLEVESYLGKVLSGTLPVNHAILYNLQDIFNLLPNISSPDFVKSLSSITNDEYFVIYISSVVRSIIALHDLISNKLSNRDAENPTAEIVAQ